MGEYKDDGNSQESETQRGSEGDMVPEKEWAEQQLRRQKEGQVLYNDAFFKMDS